MNSVCDIVRIQVNHPIVFDSLLGSLALVNICFMVLYAIDGVLNESAFQLFTLMIVTLTMCGIMVDRYIEEYRNYRDLEYYIGLARMVCAVV
jgi:hypothetical protein